MESESTLMRMNGRIIDTSGMKIYDYVPFNLFNNEPFCGKLSKLTWLPDTYLMDNVPSIDNPLQLVL